MSSLNISPRFNLMIIIIHILKFNVGYHNSSVPTKVTEKFDTERFVL